MVDPASSLGSGQVESACRLTSVSDQVLVQVERDIDSVYDVYGTRRIRRRKSSREPYREQLRYKILQMDEGTREENDNKARHKYDKSRALRAFAECEIQTERNTVEGQLDRPALNKAGN